MQVISSELRCGQHFLVNDVKRINIEQNVHALRPQTLCGFGVFDQLCWPGFETKTLRYFPYADSTRVGPGRYGQHGNQAMVAAGQGAQHLNSRQVFGRQNDIHLTVRKCGVGSTASTTSFALSARWEGSRLTSDEENSLAESDDCAPSRANKS